MFNKRMNSVKNKENTNIKGLVEVANMSKIKEENSTTNKSANEEAKYKDIEEAIQKAIDFEKTKLHNDHEKQTRVASK